MGCAAARLALPASRSGLDSGRRSGSRPGDLAGVVGTPKRPDHELAGADLLDLRADLLHDPDVLVPHRCRPDELLDAAIRPQVRAAHARRRHADDRVCRFDDPRLLALLDPHLARAVHHRPSHQRSPPTRRAYRARLDSATSAAAVTYPLVTRTGRAPQPARRRPTLPTWTSRPRSAISSPPGVHGSRPRMSGSRRSASVACRGCAAK